MAIYWFYKTETALGLFMLMIKSFEASFPLCSCFFGILMKLRYAQCPLFKCYLLTTVRGVGLSCNNNSRTHIVSVLCQNMENVRSIGRVNRSVGRFPTESVCMSSSAMDQVQCKASCCEAFCGFPRLAPSVCVFSLRSISVEVAPSHRSLDMFVVEHCILPLRIQCT